MPSGELASLRPALCGWIKVMKRKYFDISLNGSVVATRFAWNAAIRAIEEHVKQRARLLAVETEKDVSYRLVESHSERAPGDKWHFIRGYRVWQSAHETLRYTIELRADAR